MNPAGGMGPSKKAAVLGAILAALLLLAILVGIIVGTSGMLPGAGGMEIVRVNGLALPADAMATSE
jgi:hypothetical protein